MNCIITTHAVDRFLDHIDQSASRSEAFHTLRIRSKSAVRMRERTPLGTPQWRITDPDAILVVKYDQESGPVCVTVLPITMSTSPNELQMAEWNEAAADLAHLGPTPAQRDNAAKAMAPPTPAPPRAAQPPVSGTGLIKHWQMMAAAAHTEPRRQQTAQMVTFYTAISEAASMMIEAEFSPHDDQCCAAAAAAAGKVSGLMAIMHGSDVGNSAYDLRAIQKASSRISNRLANLHKKRKSLGLLIPNAIAKTPGVAS